MIKPGVEIQYTAIVEPQWANQEVDWYVYDMGYDTNGDDQRDTQYSSITADGKLYVQDLPGAEEVVVELTAFAKKDRRVQGNRAIMIGDEIVDNPL